MSIHTVTAQVELIKDLTHDVRQLDLRLVEPATLFWGLLSQRDLYYQEDLLALARKMPKMPTILTLSRPDPGWSGETARVQRLVEGCVTSVAQLAVYLCGSGGMIADVTTTVQQKGLCPIYREKYYDSAAGAKE